MGMRDITEKFSDSYERPARLYPALMALSPLAVLIVCLYGQDRLLLSSAVTAVASCGGAYVLCRIARNAGKRLQDDLFVKWGGAPSTQLLRHADKHFDIHTKERYHGVLSKGIGKKMPTPQGETADPAAADELYRAGAVWLIGQTRDAKTFPLVFRENIAFGFHRNALGLRPLGVAASGAALLWSTAHVWLTSSQALSQTEIAALIAIGYSLVSLMVWAFVLTEDALKRTGFSYAERLLQALDAIKPTAVRAPGRKTPEKGA